MLYPQTTVLNNPCSPNRPANPRWTINDARAVRLAEPPLRGPGVALAPELADQTAYRSVL
jgi:hypothetical protein